MASQDNTQTTLTVPIHVLAENVTDLANYIREGCRQLDFDVTDRDVLLAASVVVGGQPVAISVPTT